jgi:hypothetical protein
MYLLLINVLQCSPYHSIPVHLVQAVLLALCDLPCWHTVHSQRIISNITSSTHPFLIPGVDSNCFFCVLTTLSSEGLVLKLQQPNIVGACVYLSPLWSPRVFKGRSVFDSSLCFSRFPGPNRVLALSGQTNKHFEAEFKYYVLIYWTVCMCSSC